MPLENILLGIGVTIGLIVFYGSVILFEYYAEKPIRELRKRNSKSENLTEEC